MGSTCERGIYPREDIGHQRHGISIILRVINLKGCRFRANASAISQTEKPDLKLSSGAKANESYFLLFRGL